MSPLGNSVPNLDRPRRPWPPRVRTVAALVGTTGLALLASACGGSGASSVAQLDSGSATTTTESSPSSASSTRPAHQDAALAFSRCMRSHGVPSFPDPDPQGNASQAPAGVPKQRLSAAQNACKRVLSDGGGAGTRGDQQKLALALGVARCMRRHGFPTYPDPPEPTASSQGSGTRFRGTGIDTKSPRFQTAETACEQQARQALGLPGS